MPVVYTKCNSWANLPNAQASCLGLSKNVSVGTSSFDLCEGKHRDSKNYDDFIDLNLVYPLKPYNANIVVDKTPISAS